MIINLYKNCILTDAYSEVFDVFHQDQMQNTTLDRYLESLERRTYRIPNTYITNSGKISFDLEDGEDGTEFYDYNYMMINDETYYFTRYCFIDAITVVNGIAVVSYVEDVWSNYAPSLQMRKSLLTRSRIIDYGSYKIPFYSLGMEYQGNNELKITSLFENTSNKFNLIMQTQVYKLSEQGELSQRDILETYVAIKNADDTYRSSFSSFEALYLAKTLTVKSSKTQLTSGEYYEVYNILILPESLHILQESDVTLSYNVFDNVFIIALVENVVSMTNINYTATKTLPCNYKQFKVGTLLNAYDLVQNGTDITVKIGYFATNTDFNVYLNFQNQIYEITKDFMLDLPISVQTADVTQQQATAREVANLNAKLGIARGAMQIVGGVADVALGASQVNISSSWGKQLKGAGQITSGLMDAGSGIMNIISQKKQLDIANRALYVSNKGVEVLSNTALIAIYGIVVYEIQPDNEVEVQANIDNCGYVCNEIVDNLFSTITTGTTNKWNVMQFDYVNIYGKFTQRIADVLRDILNAGFKIWYDETAINE